MPTSTVLVPITEHDQAPWLIQCTLTFSTLSLIFAFFFHPPRVMFLSFFFSLTLYFSSKSCHALPHPRHICCVFCVLLPFGLEQTQPGHRVKMRKTVAATFLLRTMKWWLTSHLASISNTVMKWNKPTQLQNSFPHPHTQNFALRPNTTEHTQLLFVITIMYSHTRFSDARCIAFFCFCEYLFGS